MGDVTKPTGYVVCGSEHLRDETTNFAKPFTSKAAAVAFVNEIVSGFGGANYSFRLFELGKEIPLVADDVEVPQPAVVTKRFRVEA